VEWDNEVVKGRASRVEKVAPCTISLKGTEERDDRKGMMKEGTDGRIGKGNNTGVEGCDGRAEKKNNERDRRRKWTGWYGKEAKKGKQRK